MAIIFKLQKEGVKMSILIELTTSDVCMLQSSLFERKLSILKFLDDSSRVLGKDLSRVYLDELNELDALYSKLSDNIRNADFIPPDLEEGLPFA